MQVLHVIRSCDPRGGGPIEAIRQLARACGDEWNFSVVCTDPPDAPWIAELELETAAVGPARGRYGYAPGLRAELRRRIPDADAVVIHGLWLYPDHLAARLCRSARVPYLVYVHGMLDPAFRRLFPLRHAAKTISWHLFDRKMLEGAAAVLFTCEEERRLAPQSFGPFRARTEIVPYAVGEPPGDAAQQREKFYQRFPECRGRRLVLYLSRLHPKKGCDLLIRAFAQAMSDDARFHLVMAGPGVADWVATLKRLVATLQVGSRITWTGMLTGDLKWGAFRSAEVFVLPSHQENYGIAVVEALACSVPVLITDRVNIWKEIETDGAGLVCADTVDSFTGILRQWKGLTEEDRVAYRSAAHRCYVTRFNSRAAASRFQEVVNDIVVRR